MSAGTTPSSSSIAQVVDDVAWLDADLLELDAGLLDVEAHVVVLLVARDVFELVDVRERADEVHELVPLQRRDLVLELENESVARLRSPWLHIAFGELERVGDGAGDKRECGVSRDALDDLNRRVLADGRGRAGRHLGNLRLDRRKRSGNARIKRRRRRLRRL